MYATPSASDRGMAAERCSNRSGSVAGMQFAAVAKDLGVVDPSPVSLVNRAPVPGFEPDDDGGDNQQEEKKSGHGSNLAPIIILPKVA